MSFPRKRAEALESIAAVQTLIGQEGKACRFSSSPNAFLSQTVPQNVPSQELIVGVARHLQETAALAARHATGVHRESCRQIEVPAPKRTFPDQPGEAHSTDPVGPVPPRL